MSMIRDKFLRIATEKAFAFQVLSTSSIRLLDLVAELDIRSRQNTSLSLNLLVVHLQAVAL